MKIVVIGAVAAGTSAAAKARRNDDHAQITIYEKDIFISYSGCGMPYFIGSEIEAVDSLVPRDPAFFKKKYNIDVHIGHEVMHIDVEKKQLTVKNLQTNEVFEDSYDKLVIATGATPFKPNIEGSNQSHVFYLRNIRDAIAIKEFIEENKPSSAVIAGTGFIGFEILENLVHSQIQVEVVEVANKITPTLDGDMAQLLQNKLEKKGFVIHTSTSISKINKNTVELSSGNECAADLVILSTGVRPQVSLAKEAGVELGVTGAIKVSKQMQTNIADVYACGDCIETYSAITGKPVYRPMGSTANKTGRIAGDVLTGGTLEYKGNLGTGIFKLFDLVVGTTGLNEVQAIQEGYEIVVCHNIKPDKPLYMNGKEMVIKAVADKKTQQLLGVQIIGNEGVDKRLDVFATLISYKAKVDELFHLDLAYAPPFSTTKDPVHYTGMILDNVLNQGREIITSQELVNYEGDIQIIDARSASDFEKKGTVDGAINIPQAKLRVGLEQLDKDTPVVTFCNKGVTGNAAQNILINHGFKKVMNLSGGHKFNKESKK